MGDYLHISPRDCPSAALVIYVSQNNMRLAKFADRETVVRVFTTRPVTNPNATRWLKETIAGEKSMSRYSVRNQ